MSSGTKLWLTLIVILALDLVARIAGVSFVYGAESISQVHFLILLILSIIV